jgi:hypothetical protein
MLKKNIIIAGAIFFSLFLCACKGREAQEANPQTTGRGTEGESILPTKEPLYVPTEVPMITVIPDKHYKAREGEDSVAVIGEDKSQLFYYEEIPQEVKDRIKGKSYGDNCEVPYDELRYVKVLYRGFDGETHTGELIVNKAIAGDIVEIFEELYDAEYPIERMVLIDEYDADDNASMAANNTSAFNYRVIDDGSGRLSNHSYGLAIDINPLYNPYVRKIDAETVISPESGEEYADRTLDCRYYIREGDACYQAFTGHGFTWGGDWKNTKDYQHFQKLQN